MNWNDPASRHELLERVGVEEYEKQRQAHVATTLVSTVNGYAIRTVESRFGTLYAVEGTASAFSKQSEAEDFAKGRSPLVPCRCNAGKLTITAHEMGKPPRAVELDCVFCNGIGKITAAQKAAEEAFWCRCGNPSGESIFHDDNEPGAICSKHHYTCRDCGAVTQTG